MSEERTNVPFAARARIALRLPRIRKGGRIPVLRRDGNPVTQQRWKPTFRADLERGFFRIAAGRLRAHTDPGVGRPLRDWSMVSLRVTGPELTFSPWPTAAAHSPERPFVHRVAFSEDEGQQRALGSVLFRPGPLSGRDDMVQAVSRWSVERLLRNRPPL